MILPVLRSGWMNLRRDRSALILTFIVPIVFFSIFASVFAEMGNTEAQRIGIAIVDEDRSEASAALIKGLRAEEGLEVLEPEHGAVLDRPGAEDAVRNGDVPVAVVIPKGFGETEIAFTQEAQKPTLQLIADRSDPIAAGVARGLLHKVTMTSVPQLLIQGGINELNRWSGGLNPQQKAMLEIGMASMGSQAAAPPTATSSPSTVVEIETRDILGESKRSPAVAFFAAGIGVMFMLFSASAASGTLLDEQDSGMLDRLLATRLTFGELMFGKLLFLTTLGVVQLTLMFVWGMFVFGLELESHLLGFFVMALFTALAASAFGLVLAAMSRTRAQLGAITTLAVLTISAVGGSMFPRYLMPEGLQQVGLVFFNSWALDGFTKVFWRDAPLTALGPEVAVLAGNALVLFLVARILARRWETD